MYGEKKMVYLDTLIEKKIKNEHRKYIMFYSQRMLI